MRKLARFSVAVGGSLIMLGLMLTCVLFLVLLGVFDVNSMAAHPSKIVLTILLVAIAMLDLIAGIILLWS